ncbi:MAG TPA: hypothetical protein VF006_28560 [Longimicrobium sp.]
MAAVALDHLRGPATRTLHLPRGSLRPPIERWGQSDECSRVSGADKDHWRDDRPLYKVASPRVARSRGPRGWIALCTDHGADPRIHAPVRTGRHLPAADRSVTLAYRLSRAEPCPVRKHVVVVYGNVGALLRGRSVDLPVGRTYRLGDDLTLGTVGIGPDDENGYVVTRDLPVGEFLRLCEELSFNDLYLIGCDRVLAENAVQQRRARARLAPASRTD